MSAIPVQDTLKYINEARTNPSGFAKYVKKEIDMFIDNDTLPLFPGCNYSTNEGKGAWKEAYQFLNKHQPMAPYTLNQGLSLAAEDHAIDLAKTGIFGHNGSNGCTFMQRIQKRCGKSYGAAGQNIGSQFKVEGRNHALQTVLGLIIDDGVSSRGHRNNIYSKDFKFIGISSRVQGDKIITVIDFHSTNLPTSNGSKNNNDTGANLVYENKKQPSFGGNSFGGNSSGGNNTIGANLFENFDHDFQQKFHQFGGGHAEGSQVSPGNTSSGGRRVISKSTSTKTKTANGVTTKIKITKLKYSDGTEEEETQQTVTQ